jgi:hypothetical protein
MAQAFLAGGEAGLMRPDNRPILWEHSIRSFDVAALYCPTHSMMYAEIWTKLSPDSRKT